MAKKIIALMLVVLAAFAMIVSCSENNSQVTTTFETTDTAVATLAETTVPVETDEETTTIEETETTETSVASTEETEPSNTTKVTAEPIEIQVYEITITYVFSDGTKAATTRKALYEAGTVLDVESPEIEGYEPNLKRVYWSYISREKVFRVVYSPIETTEQN